jgi:hypothetical protein
MILPTASLELLQKWLAVGRQATRDRDPRKLLDTLLALDQGVVELFMRVYDILRRDRSILRAQNRRLHNAVRETRLDQKASLRAVQIVTLEKAS